MRKVNLILLLTALWALAPKAYTCTTAIIPGKLTPDRRPLLWKNRDTGVLDNKLMYFTEGKYDYIGLVNSDDTLGRFVWMGMNESGFAIMNSASYNLNTDIEGEVAENEGKVMKIALAQCRTVDDFSRMLENLPRPWGLQSNFGVIDGEGGAAYFETSTDSYVRIDIGDENAETHGCLIRTNYSVSGEGDRGQGYIRYATAEGLFQQAARHGNLTVEFIIQDATRSLQHSLTGTDLEKEGMKITGEQHFTWFADYIPRFSTSASIVIQGKKPGEQDDLMTMWTVLGFPLCSVVYPVLFNKDKALPGMLKAGENGHAPLSDKAMALKSKCFPVQRGHGEDYIDLAQLINGSGTGILQLLRPMEARVFEESHRKIDAWRMKKPNSGEIISFYEALDASIGEAYRSMFGL